MIPAAPASARRLRRLAAVAAADHLVRVAHRHERDAGGRSAIRRTSSIERSKVAPALSAADDARWSVAPSASGSEYGRPTSSTSAPASMHGERGLVARLEVRVAGDDVRHRAPSGPRPCARARTRARMRSGVPRRSCRVPCRSRVVPCSLAPRARTTRGPCRRARRSRAGPARPPGTARRCPPCRQGAAAAPRSRGPSRARAGCPRSRR